MVGTMHPALALSAPDAELWYPSALGCIGPPGLLGAMARDAQLRYAAVPRSDAESSAPAGVNIARQMSGRALQLELSRPRGPGGLHDYLKLSVNLDTKTAVLDDWWFNVPRTRAAARGWSALWAHLGRELRSTGVLALIARVDRALDRSLLKRSNEPFPRFETINDLMTRHCLGAIA